MSAPGEAEPNAARGDEALARRILAVAALLTVLAYHPVLGADFVNYDDGVYVLDNPVVRDGLQLSDLPELMTLTRHGFWGPLTWGSHALDVSLFGLRAPLHHLVNLLLHLLAGLLLFRALLRLTERALPSAVVVALFWLHPLHVEAVAWVSSRKDVLSAVFFALTLGAWAAYLREGKRNAYLGALGALALGLMCKPTLMSLPVVLLALGYWPGVRPAALLRARLRELLPFAALSLASAAVTLIAHRGAGALQSLSAVPMSDRVATAIVGLGEYLWRTLKPWPLAAHYPHPEGAWSPIALLLSLVVLAALTAWALRLRRRQPVLLLGWVSFGLMLAPMSGLVQFGSHATADRFTYLPHVGLFLALVFAHSSRRWLWGLAAAAAMLAALSLVQARTWQDSVTLFTHATQVRSESFVAWHNLGIAQLQRGRSNEAIPALERARSISPGEPDVHEHLAQAYQQAGRYAEALEAARRFLALRPDDAEALALAGMAQVAVEGAAAAAPTLARAAQRDPARVELRWLHAEALIASDQGQQAITVLREALGAFPGDAQLHNVLGIALEKQGQRAAAIASFEAALARDPGYRAAAQNLARLRSNPLK